MNREIDGQEKKKTKEREKWRERPKMKKESNLV